MDKKILIIGQAPPAVKQGLPYDTTQLYDWFEELGISKGKAQDLFDFDAVYDKFPGFASGGGHKKPSNEQMEEYWERSLKEKVENSKSILVLGGVARDFLKNKNIDKKMVFVIHPSKRNTWLYNKNKESILGKIKGLL
ncbi:MAG: hypothetical protein CMH22_05680 [Methylophaga sp.]|nr:hypothetical protein [Methylophaga sp.]|tara:strand:+ start:98579 stop:98992 length:414 start_codon:yes stop_codon:yes gene_type:complete